MGLLGGLLGGGRGGMSPLTMALLGVLAYRTFKGKARNVSPGHCWRTRRASPHSTFDVIDLEMQAIADMAAITLSSRQKRCASSAVSASTHHSSIRVTWMFAWKVLSLGFLAATAMRPSRISLISKV